LLYSLLCFFFFFNTSSPTEIYTLSLHDALPISEPDCRGRNCRRRSSSGRPSSEVMQLTRRARSARVARSAGVGAAGRRRRPLDRSEEHTSELQSRSDLVCRLLLEKKKKKQIPIT